MSATIDNSTINAQILIVDDEEDLREILKFILRKFGVTVHVAEDATQALAMLETNHVDLIFSDIKMPRIDGFEFLSRILAKLPTPPKFVFITGGTDLSPEQQQIIADKTNGILSKPFKKEMLFDKIVEQLPDKVFPKAT